MRPGDVKGLWKVAGAFAGRVAPAIIGPEMETKGHVALFIDATGTEMDGQFFQWARKDCNGNRSYRLHGPFPGGLWSAGTVAAGGAAE